ncbi:hypothetical protein RJ639_036634 [Escallonia herrerae]|uniref:Uncharacterized protein n=1 Tax=Escallonia herrerae TaxID=1293975 RepID=A0AA89B6S4_9ASTE|nr:hypothetical protein RJ639_036634 [Escallonia herrerae]
MMVVTNMVKLSSLSIAKASLGTPGTPQSTKKLASVAGTATVARNSSLPQFPRTPRSQEPQSSSKPIYLIQPDEGNVSSYIIDEEKSVDVKASDFIRKVHEKNRYDSSETSDFSPHLMPPPPRVFM